MIGHKKQKSYFSNIIKLGSLNHAYLFSGPDMIGKKTFALELARELLGDNIVQNPDFKLIAPRVDEGESKIYIEDIRDLKKFLSLKSYDKNYRIVVFDDAHRLTAEASNAFLKILEEPPAGSVIILVSSMAGTLPATILSRCEEVKFATLSHDEVSEALTGYKKLSKGDKDFLVKLARGRVGLAVSMAEGEGVAIARKAIEDLRTVLNKGSFERMEYAKKMYEGGKYKDSIDSWLYWVSAHLAVSPKNEKIVKELLALNQIISQPQYNHRLALENFLLNL